MRVRCPHCHNPVEIVDDVELSDIPCPSCGSSFSLLDDKTKSFDPKTKTIGHFELIDQIGIGAFGSVWMARDTKLDRTVAIKIPRKEQLDSEDIEKFFREARAAAQLQHTNIVSVHEVGRDGDSIYIVSDYIKGLSLSDWLTGQQLTHQESAELCAKIASAVHHAHLAGVVHRDLKPSNIMLDPDGEPHVMDFGLAKRDAGEITMTMDGKILGTPAYMSPEQGMGDSHKADRRSDVYSLGVILFELLTGDLPFRGNSRMLIHQVIHQDAPSPRSLNASISRDLETICLKCLEKEPYKRYPSAKALSDDLGRAVRGEPIQASPSSRLEKAWRWCKRKPAVAAAVFAFALLPIVMSAAFVRQTILTRQNAIARVEILLNAAPSTIPLILEDLDNQAMLVRSRLNELASQELSPSQEIRVRLALLPFDSAQLSVLNEHLIECSYEELTAILERIRKYGGTSLAPNLWETFHGDTSPQAKSRSGIALAALDPESDQWTEHDYQYIASSLLQEVTFHQPAIRQAVSPIAANLVAPVSKMFKDVQSNQTVLESAAAAIVDFGGHDTVLLTEMSMVATPKQHAILFPEIAVRAKVDDSIVETLVEVTKLQPEDDYDEVTRVALGKRRAGAAINLLRLEQPEESLEVLRVNRDPESLTQFVHGCKPRGITAEQLLDLLNRATSVSERYGLLLALGEFELVDISEDIRPSWVDYIKELYANDPSSGIHGVSGWLLREWGLTAVAKEIDERPVPYSEDREWYSLAIDLSGLGDISYFTFVVFPAGDYRIGSPDYERARGPEEVVHVVRLTRRFAILDREISRGEYEAYRKHLKVSEYSKTMDSAMVGTSWYDSVRYCRWLTVQWGKSESDQSYADPMKLDEHEYPADPDPAAEGLPRNWTLSWNKSGFRLPTESEWEVACRVGFATRYGFGCDESHLRSYGWYQTNTESSTQRTRELRPNVRGLFDLHGNALEWVHDWLGNYPLRLQLDPVGKSLGRSRVSRGGSWTYTAANCRTANRLFNQPTNRASSVGFRIAQVPFREKSSQASE